MTLHLHCPILGRLWDGLIWQQNSDASCLNHMFHEVKPTAFANLTWFSENQRNPVRVDHPSSTPWSLPTSYGGPSQAFFMAWSTKGFWCDRRFCLGILFSRKDLCIYIYTHYTVCNYKMCMCIVYYRYMVRIDDRSIFFQSHGKSQRSSRLSLLEATKKFPWNTWSSWNPKSVTRDEA